MALRFMQGSRVPSTILDMRIAGLLLLAELILGTLGFILLEEYDFSEAIYMTVITISTVGFTEVEPLSSVGRFFTSVLILFNIGIFAYLLAAFSYYVIEGKIFHTLYVNRIKEKIDRMEEHIIICGFGKYGEEVADNLLIHRMPFVVIEIDPIKIDDLQKREREIPFVEGDATQDEILQAAGISRARGLISALSDDSDNLFIVLTARQLNPRLRIISRATQPRSEPKLVKAGANHVVMPNRIGGFYMATLISKPGAVEFFSFITNEYHSDIGFEEIRYDDLIEPFRDQPIREMHLRSKTGVNIIAFRTRSGEFSVNPAPDTRLAPGDSFIVLGSDSQLLALRQLLGKASR